MGSVLCAEPPPGTTNSAILTTKAFLKNKSLNLDALVCLANFWQHGQESTLSSSSRQTKYAHLKWLLATAWFEHHPLHLKQIGNPTENANGKETVGITPTARTGWKWIACRGEIPLKKIPCSSATKTILTKQEGAHSTTEAYADRDLLLSTFPGYSSRMFLESTCMAAWVHMHDCCEITRKKLYSLSIPLYGHNFACNMHTWMSWILHVWHWNAIVDNTGFEDYNPQR